MNTYLEMIESTLQNTFAKGLADIAKLLQHISPMIKIAVNEDDINKVLALRKSVYPKCYPNSPVDTLDQYDYASLLLFAENDKGQAIGSCRLLIDTEQGLLEEDIYKPYISKYRGQGKLLAEWGRCIVTNDCPVRAFDFADVIKELAYQLGIEYVLIFNRQCDVPRVLKRLDATVLTKTNKTFGSQHKFTAVLWRITQKKIYESKLWDSYSRSFLTITTRYQIEVLTEASRNLRGNVVDCGSGCAKIAPYLINNSNINSYTAIDASPLMCQLGERVLSKLNKSNFQIKESYIEYWQANSLYESAVSINSLYTWSNPLKVLKHIYLMLRLNGVFVLANINDNIDIPLLIQNTKPDLLMHPDYDIFCQVNLTIDENTEAHRYSLDEMIQLVREAGFSIIQCHDHFFEGGLTFMVLQKTE